MSAWKTWAQVTLVVCVTCALVGSVAFAQGRSEATSAQQVEKLKTEVQQWTTSISTAGRLFQNERFADSAKLIGEVQAALEAKLETANENTLRLLKPIHRKLVKAHRLLLAQGATLAPLKALPDGRPGRRALAQQTSIAEGKQISFVNQIAPMIVRKCGNCHVSGGQGGFNAGSFMALVQSGTIEIGMPAQSRLVEVIESGEMPKGNLNVEPAELVLLKTWIAQGAHFDGQNPKTPLTASRPMIAESNTSPSAPTAGKETVSFGLHVAPILLENCAQCHIARNPRGNFSMADVAAMVRGGNTGVAFKAGESRSSEIILRMKGMGRAVMPPSGKLADDEISMVARWIDQGAVFDPADGTVPLNRVAAKAVARSLDHGELTEARQAEARKLWQLALAGIPANTSSTKNFFVMGTNSVGQLKAIGARAEELAARVKQTLKSPESSVFAKGNTTLFVLSSRYDFSEFGRMVERRPFDKSVTSSWKSEVAENYIVMLNAGSKESETRKSEANRSEIGLVRNLAAVHVTGWNATIPRWFADGMGYWTAAKMFRRSKDLESQSQNALAAMRRPDDFITGAMAADQAALVGYLFVGQLQRNSQSFKKLVKRLRAATSFETAFADAYGISPKQFYGSYKKSNRPR